MPGDNNPIRMKFVHQGRHFRVVEGDDDFDGGDEGGDGPAPSGYGEGDFLQLDNGKTFIRKFEVVAFRWERYINSDDGLSWCLKVFFSDCPHSVLYGEEAADALRSFGLPTESPDE